MQPRLEAVYFGQGQYPRLARVLEMTARRHCPGWEIGIRKIDPHALRAASGSSSHGDNHHKLAHWERTVREAADGAQVLLVDADTFVTGPLDALWELPFDLAYTVRDSSRFPLNGGVVAVRVSQRVRSFMAEWLGRDALFMRDASLHQPWRQRYGGINQASFGSLLESGAPAALGLQVAALPCLVWNCEDTTWGRFDPDVTRIVHVKSALRMAVFNIAAAHKLRRLVRMWRDLDAEAERLESVA